jgi:transposase
MLYTATDVEIYLDKADPERIALHRRDRRKWGYTTVPDHMPSHHRHVAEWSAERFVRWAAETGPWTKEVVEKIMSQCLHPEQGFHMSMGVINLAKKFDKERLEMACKRAAMFKAYRYTAVKNILEKGLEREGEEAAPRQLPAHENIRGQSYYN